MWPLTDVQCASTCAIFSELVSQVGVKFIVAGGHPVYGKMQAVSGVRGALAYDLDALTDDFTNVENFFPEFTPETIIGARNYYNIKIASFNVMDIIRRNQTFPTEFAYEPADCRIFYTPETFNNYTNLWHYAANALWGNGTCVKGSAPDHCGNGTTSVNGTCGGNSTSPFGNPPTPTASGSAPIVTGAANKVTSMGLAMVLLAGLAALF